jgi:hypothetical protein
MDEMERVVYLCTVIMGDNAAAVNGPCHREPKLPQIWTDNPECLVGLEEHPDGVG